MESAFELLSRGETHAATAVCGLIDDFTACAALGTGDDATSLALEHADDRALVNWTGESRNAGSQASEYDERGESEAHRSRG